MEVVVCGLCGTTGATVHQSPNTLNRLLKTLDLNKLPPLLTEERVQSKIGLCENCEKKISLIEEASLTKESLKESFVERLRCISVGDYNSNAPLCYTSHNNLAVKRTNEVTPEQHSWRRNIPSMLPSVGEEHGPRVKRKKITAITVGGGCNNNNDLSDEENIHMVSHTSPSISPRSSAGSYTPPPTLPAGTKVLSELTSSRNRRKQARPAKAEVPSETVGTPDVPPSPLPSADPLPKTSLSPIDLKLLEAFNRPPPAHSPRASSQGSATPSPRTWSNHSPLPRAPSAHSSSAGGWSSHAPSPVPRPVPAATASTNLIAEQSTGPFTSTVPTSGNIPTTAPPMPFSQMYQSMLVNGLAMNSPAAAVSQAPASALMFAQMAMNNPMLFGQVRSRMQMPFSSASLPAVAAASRFPGASSNVPQANLRTSPLNFSRPSTPRSTPPGSAQRSIPGSTPHPVAAARSTAANAASAIATPMTLVGTPSSMPGPSSGSSAEAHTLMKTEKRRYCKVCTVAQRKANNGRPPQSRFLCIACGIAMCRNCIEEHRYLVRASQSVNGKSASAKLLQAVSMKNRANRTPRSRRSGQSSPSSSSLLYASLSGSSNPATTITSSSASLSPTAATVTTSSSASNASVNFLVSPATTSRSPSPSSTISPQFSPVIGAQQRHQEAVVFGRGTSPETNGPETGSPTPVNPVVKTEDSPDVETEDRPVVKSENSPVVKTEKLSLEDESQEGLKPDQDQQEEAVISPSELTPKQNEPKEEQSPSLAKEDAQEEEDGEGRLVISEETIITPEMANETAAMLVGNNVELASPSSSEGTESSGGESSSSGEVSSRAEQTDVHQLAYNKYERVTIPLY